MIFPLILILTMVFSGCVQDWIWPEETRIQLINESQFQIKDLRIKALDHSQKDIVLVPETLEPGERSRVYTVSLSGEFNLELSTSQILCENEQIGDTLISNCSGVRVFDQEVLEGGSIRFRYYSDSKGGNLTKD